MDLKLKIDGADHLVQAQLIGTTLWVHSKGRTFTVDATSGRRARRKTGGAGASDVILAPMPGKVIKIFSKTGDPVKAGQAVLVMEAMKMEYTLKSDLDGIIDVISCAVGDQVTLGKHLVKLMPAAKES
jgi:biotin carboxyl carrier protein